MAQTLSSSRQRSMPPGQARRAQHQAMLAIYIALFLLAILSFAGLAVEVTSHALVALNTAALMSIHTMVSPTNDQVALALTKLGSVPGIALMAAVLAGVLFYRNRAVDAVAVGAIVIGGAALTEVVKKVFHQPRPALFTQIVQEHGYGFPSGHTTLSFCLFGFLAAWLVLEGPRRALNWVGALVCLLLAAAIAASRLYLGVHWPTDVAGGFTIALGWVSAVLAARHVYLSRQEMQP